ncbi:MAG: hypothetical protein ACXWQO_08400 [Bdellovibrionota bacterium]
MKIYVLSLAVFLILNQNAFAEASSLSSPNISANALFLYRGSNLNRDSNSTTRNGIDLQEAELGFYSDVDPYSSLNLLLTVHPEYTANSSGSVDQAWKVEPEELFAESSHVPFTTLKLGKFKAAVGKHNILHDHAFPLVDKPVANQILMGDDGLNDVGVSAAVLLPTSWFSEITGQFLRGGGENKEFKAGSPSDGVGVGHWKNLWDLTEALTGEVGGSYVQGNNYLKSQTKLYGADLTFKWRPIEGGKYHSWILAGEFLRRDLGQPGAQKSERGSGGNIWAQYQFAKAWAAVVRYDHLRMEASDAVYNSNAVTNGVTDKYSAALNFSPSEFSSFRAEYDHAVTPPDTRGYRTERKFYVQANFTIGAHPSHSY